MLQTIDYVLERYLWEIKEMREIAAKLEEEPLLFFTDLNKKREGILPMLLEEKDEEELINYQNWLYPLVINRLMSKYNITDFQLSYNPTLYPSPIFLTVHKETVGMIHLTSNLIEYIVPPEITQLIARQAELLEEEMVLEERISMNAILEANPMLIGKGSAWKTTQVMFRKEKAKKKVKEEALSDLDTLSLIRREVSENARIISDRVDSMRFNLLSLERLSKRAEQELYIHTINPYPMIEASQQNQREEIEKMRVEYRKELYNQYGIDWDENEPLVGA